MNPTETLAGYYRKAARAGKGVTFNTGHLAKHLGMSQSQVYEARDELYRSGRLITKMGHRVVESIDGVKFTNHEPPTTPTEPLMNYLRKTFVPVYDARVSDSPEKAVRRGRPAEVVIGDKRVGIGFAAAMVLCQSRLCMA